MWSWPNPLQLKLLSPFWEDCPQDLAVCLWESLTTSRSKFVSSGSHMLDGKAWLAFIALIDPKSDLWDWGQDYVQGSQVPPHEICSEGQKCVWHWLLYRVQLRRRLHKIYSSRDSWVIRQRESCDIWNLLVVGATHIFKDFICFISWDLLETLIYLHCIINRIIIVF